ncbi:MAG TPA: sterol desaturase family protein [Polyangiaceae bacterium]|jgi:lathosterol oxidase
MLAHIDWLRVLAFVGGSVGIGLVMYFGLCGGLYYFKYVRDRSRAADWKCQPERWLSPEMNRHAIRLGAANMTLGSVLSGLMAAYVWTGGKSALYFDFKEHGIAFTIASIAFVFLLTDLGAYWSHRLYHRKAAFQRFHKWHHRYGAPTPFTVTAMHPVEFITYQSIFLLPAFIVPMHVFAYYGLLLYVFYYNVCDHSGVKHRALVPWQPPSIFHDDHHRYFHCNFGQSSLLWDRVYGTLRRVGRRYGENVYGGRGVSEGAAPDADRFVEY